MKRRCARRQRYARLVPNLPGSRGAIPSEQDGRQAELIKRAARDQWSADPAGGVAAEDAELGTPASFARIERYRYLEQPWMHETFRFERFAGKRVLEIGVGLGTDHLQFARAGAIVTGIDLVPRCIELTGRRMDQEQLSSHLHVMDAEHLQFADDAFDVVYSFGVLHHTASAEKAFAEVRRVLRPDGVFIGGLYNRYSAFVATMLLQQLTVPGQRHMSFARRLSLIEYASSHDRALPYVRLFGARELRRALHGAGFGEIRLTRRHFGVKLTHKIPHWLEEAISRTAGWYLIHEAA